MTGEGKKILTQEEIFEVLKQANLSSSRFPLVFQRRALLHFHCGKRMLVFKAKMVRTVYACKECGHLDIKESDYWVTTYRKGNIYDYCLQNENQFMHQKPNSA